MSRHKLLVKKRDNSLVPVRFDEITDRLTVLCETEPKLDNSINPFDITKQVLDRIKNGITTSEIDDFTAELCAHNLNHPDYHKLASRLVISNHHKNLKTSTGLLFSEVCQALNKNKDQNGDPCPNIHPVLYRVSQEYKDEIDSIIDYSRDFDIDFFGFKTLQNSYLQKILVQKNDNKNSLQIVECPQHMYLRVALAIECSRIKTDRTDRTDTESLQIPDDFFKNLRKTYELLSGRYYVHATPTLYNAGTNRQQLFSCFLLNMGDSVKDIFKCYSDVAQISKWAGGIGISISDVRGSNSYVRGTGGRSDGLVPMLQVLDATSTYINQGSRRNGSFVVYLEPWHVDIFGFLESRRIHGKARNLFYGLWIPDNFMAAVKGDEYWYLMCPFECPGLTETYGSAYEELYNKYVSEGKYREKVKAMKIWNEIINSQIETGMPYMCYKDHVNNKTNHQNLGTIKSSNLCVEVMEYNSTEKYACCCLSSLILPSFVIETENGPVFDYDKLIDVTRTATRNLDTMIDFNYYPVPETKVSNMSERPIGVGVQGLADVFFKFKVSYDSPEAAVLNKKIFETIYYAAVLESCSLAKKNGPYPSFKGSPMSKGIFQFDMWSEFDHKSLMYDWDSLRTDVMEHGVRNSLVTCAMPTASTATISNSTECFEPISSNIYTRKVLAGEFIVINKYLTQELVKQGIWSERIKNKIINARGSVQGIVEIPEETQKIYRTCWELKQTSLINLSVDRAPFIDQSQSLNLFFAVPEFNKISSAHFYGHSKGLKTGMYYLRSKSANNSEAISSSRVEEKEKVDKTNFFQIVVGKTVNTSDLPSAPSNDCDTCSG